MLLTGCVAVIVAAVTILLVLAKVSVKIKNEKMFLFYKHLNEWIS